MTRQVSLCYTVAVLILLYSSAVCAQKIDPGKTGGAQEVHPAAPAAEITSSGPPGPSDADPGKPRRRYQPANQKKGAEDMPSSKRMPVSADKPTSPNGERTAIDFDKAKGTGAPGKKRAVDHRHQANDAKTKGIDPDKPGGGQRTKIDPNYPGGSQVKEKTK